MDKINEVVDQIHKSLKELVALTGDEHISAFIIRDAFMLNTYGEKQLSFERINNNE